MELLFTQATVVVELFGMGYVASSFATYAHRRLNQPASWKSRTTFTSVTPTEDVSGKRTPSGRKPPPVELLRQQCQQAGIKWRNAHGKNKHLKKAEMIAALQELEQAKRIAASQSQSKSSLSSRRRAA
jgi:hypothetical protein